MYLLIHDHRTKQGPRDQVFKKHVDVALQDMV